MIKKDIKTIFSDRNMLYIIFLMFFTILSVFPIAGDDWGNAVMFDGSIIGSFKTAYEFYLTWEGRFIGRVLIVLLTYNKVLFNICTALLMVLLFKTIFKIINTEKVYIKILIVLSVLFVNTLTFSQTYTWIAGSITYLYPSILTIYYFATLCAKEKKKQWNIIILFILSCIIPMFVENIGCAFVAGNIIYLIYMSIKNKKCNVIALILTIISTVSLISMLKSPGSAIRLEQTRTDIPFLEMFINNISAFIDYSFGRNIIVLILMCIPINYSIYKKTNKKILPLIFDIIPIIMFIKYLPLMSPIDLSRYSFIKQIDCLPNLNSGIFLIYWIIFAILFLYSIYSIIKDKEKRLTLILFYIIALLANGAMLFTPVWGERVAVMTILIEICISVVLLNDIDIPFKINMNIICIILLVLSIIYFSIICIKVYDLKVDRDRYLREEVINSEKEIIVPIKTINYLWNYIPWNEYHMATFKRYYKIPNEVNVILKFPYEM